MDANTPLTATDRETLDFIRVSIDEHGYAPTLQEIADHFGISKVSAHGRVGRLIDRRLVTRSTNNAARAIHLADRCPCCGHQLAAT